MKKFDEIETLEENVLIESVDLTDSEREEIINNIIKCSLYLAQNKLSTDIVTNKIIFTLEEQYVYEEKMKERIGRLSDYVLCQRLDFSRKQIKRQFNINQLPNFLQLKPVELYNVFKRCLGSQKNSFSDKYTRIKQGDEKSSSKQPYIEKKQISYQNEFVIDYQNMHNAVITFLGYDIGKKQNEELIDLYLLTIYFGVKQRRISTEVYKVACNYYNMTLADFDRLAIMYCNIEFISDYPHSDFEAREQLRRKYPSVI